MVCRIQCSFICVIALFVSVSAFAQGPVQPSPQIRSGVVVLQDGRVFKGSITAVAGGYRVDHDGRYAIVPFDQVRLTAQSISAAFMSLRDAVPNPTTNDHLKLAEWCLENQLFKEAKLEVARALSLEPLRKEARILAAKIDQQSQRVNGKAISDVNGTTPAKKPYTVTNSASAATSANSSGLSREAQLEFMQHVQPLMMNKCGNAHCHGSASKNDFQLKLVRRGSNSSRVASRSNLEQLLTMIAPQHPERSRLLIVPTSSTESHRKLFVGEQGNKQFALLKRWVMDVAPHATGAPSHDTEARNSTTPNIAIHVGDSPQRIVPAAGTMPRNGVQPRMTTPPRFASTDMNRPLQESSEAKLLRQIREEDAPDAFDPEEFNRMMHGTVQRDETPEPNQEEPIEP